MQVIIQLDLDHKPVKDTAPFHFPKRIMEALKHIKISSVPPCSTEDLKKIEAKILDDIGVLTNSNERFTNAKMVLQDEKGLKE